ncbi:MAG: response regulator [Hyphomicrobiaceae bacterium]|nr:response regulator [Hyphomicrobiaceae bacterium]
MSQLTGYRVLIAEDEALVALQLEEVVRDMGCEVVGPVSRLADLIARIEARDFDGALLDINLRGELVFDSLPRFRALGTPFIVTSGYDAKTLFPPDFRDAPRITKPFDEAALRRMCLEVFAKPSA